MADYPKLANPQRARVFAQLRSVVGSIRDRSTGLDEAPGQIVINFPAMPETIELVRRANYVNMLANSPATPDGFHFYRSTDPLKIPVKFAVHAFDADYTKADGPVALLQMAARLHALTLPIIKAGAHGTGSGVETLPAAAAPPTGVGVQRVEASQVNTSASFEKAQASNANEQFMYFPAPCHLNILMARWKSTEYGIHCAGFVEEVSVVLRGPWLQGRASGGSMDEDDLRNLPSSADFSFTFVHQPGFTNNYIGGRSNAKAGSALMLQALAADVYQRLYNQVQLGKLSSVPSDAGIDISAVNLFGESTQQ